MSEFILYHNPRWGKSRGAVSLLEENGVEFTKVEYLKAPLSKHEILSLSKKLGIAPSGFVRKNESDFKENDFENILNDDVALAQAIEQFPKIMERPIAVRGERAVIGRPVENVLTIIKWQEMSYDENN